MADDEGTVEEGGAEAAEPLGEAPEATVKAEVHRNPNGENYPLEVAGEEEVTTQEDEDEGDDEDDEEDEEEDEEDDEEEDEELDAMIKVSNVQAGNVA